MTYVTGHAMTYASTSGGRLPSSTDEYIQDGLLTEDEVYRLAPAHNKQRDLLITWYAHVSCMAGCSKQ